MMKILIIRYKKTKGVPEGGEQASEKNLQVLKRIAGDNNVDTVFIHDESQRHTLLEYAKGILFMPWGYYFGLTPQRVRTIVQKAQNYNVVFVDRSIFGIIAKHLKEIKYQGRIVCFFHNVESVYFASKYSSILNPVRWLTTNCADRNDYYCCKYADQTITLSKRDDDILYSRYSRHADQIIPISFVDTYLQDTYPSDSISSTPLCMFLGAYFPANIEGIEWFVRNVFPYVQIKMQIVGKGMDKLRNAEWMSKDIELYSDVPNLRPLFEAADIMVFPIFKGSGMKVKTCESLMYGKNIIGTPEAWSGYDLDYSAAGACCQTAKEFINAINGFIHSPRPRFNTYSRTVFLEKYSADRMVDKYRATLTD